MSLIPFTGRCIHCGHDHGNAVFSMYKDIPNTASGNSVSTNEQLTARVRELEAEVERLKRTNSSYANLTKAQESQLTNLRQRLYQLKGADSAIDSERQANCELTEQLAAEQLNNKLLREALEFLNARIVTMDLGGVVERALPLPASTEALDKHVAEKVKEAGKFDGWKTNPYTKVLETSIEQLTKQRDLAVYGLNEAEVYMAYCKPIEAMREIRKALSAIKESEVKE